MLAFPAGASLVLTIGLMLRFLFPRLTPASPPRGTALFAAVTADARAPHWYVEGGVADTLDGRFAMLATIAALVTVRLERSDTVGDAAVALAERFVEAMDAEHRQLGLNDPGLGKTVRRLVGLLATRVRQWREAVDGGDWNAAVIESLYRGEPDRAGQAHTAAALRQLWERLIAAPDAAVVEGRFG